MKGDIFARLLQTPQVHQYLILNTSCRKSSQLCPFTLTKALDCLDQSNRADGDEILKVLACVIEFLDNMRHQTQVMLD
ncbi:hypothetical protein D3C81_1918860 [compost metagenome]